MTDNRTARATDIIGRQISHTTAADITARITDILFDRKLTVPEMLLLDVTTEQGQATIMVSPQVMVINDGNIALAADADQIRDRVLAAGPDNATAVNPSDYPSTIIGPFGNVISPSMIAAIFNARTGLGEPDQTSQTGGIWFTDIKDRPVRAHVADVGHIIDVLLDADMARVDAVVLKALTGMTQMLPPDQIIITGDDQRMPLLSSQPEGQ